MTQTRILQLKKQNQSLKQRIQLIQNQQNQGNLKDQIAKFVQESQKNLTQMNKKIGQQNSKQNQILHKMTASYQLVLKKQIQLLNQNKVLSEQKQKQDKKFNEQIQKVTLHYEGQIKQFQTKVKSNVKKIQQMANGGNMINRLLGNARFRQAMEEKGCSLEALQKQSKIEEVSNEVQQIQKQITEAQAKSSSLDEQLTKMHELIDTMKSLLENMLKQKDNILKQNAVLKQKLKQSEELIGKLLGTQVVNENDQEQEEQEEQQNIEEDK